MRRSRISGKIRIRSGRAEDLDSLLEIEASVFTADHMSRRSFLHFLNSAQAEFLVSGPVGRTVGYALVILRRGSRVARLYSIGVARAAAGRGIGIALLRAAENAAIRRGADRMRLEVQAGNRAAIARYEKSGYRRTGRTESYYNDGSDALHYEKELRPSDQMG